MHSEPSRLNGTNFFRNRTFRLASPTAGAWLLNEADLPDLREIFGIRKACVPPATPDAPFEDY